MSDIRVLHVDDSPALLDIAATFLERANERLAVATETEPGAAVDRLDDVDCIVSDYKMPEMDGLELLAAVRERRPDLPFVLLTSLPSGDIAEEAFAAGATDYRRKETGTSHYRALAHSIERAVEHRRATRRVAALEASHDRMESFLSSVAREVDSAVATAERALADADGTPPADVESAHRRLRELSSELREMDDPTFHRASTIPEPADD